jgi:hypothetical protein
MDEAALGEAGAAARERYCIVDTWSDEIGCIKANAGVETLECLMGLAGDGPSARGTYTTGLASCGHLVVTAIVTQ